MNREQAIDQFFFEHYFNKYIQVIKDHGWNIQGESLRPYRFILEGLSLMVLSVQKSSSNKLRAKLLIITTSVVQLQELLNDENLDDLSENTIIDVCYYIQTLRTAVQNITQYAPSFQFKTIYKKCLCHLNSLWEQATSDPKNVDLTSLNELWSALRELVCQALPFMEDPNECSCQLLQKINGEQVGEGLLCSLSYLNEIMGKGPEESDDEEEIRALQEKLNRRKMKRHQSSDSSEEQVTPQAVRQMENGSFTSTPEKMSVESAQEQPVEEMIMMITESDSSSDLEQNLIDNQENPSNHTDNRKYPILPDVKPRQSLLNFTRKPPSHAICKQGRWLPDEEEEFILKTIQTGEGKWAVIKKELQSVRSSVQLKDKWRQISLGRVEKVARQYGLKYAGSKKK